VESVKRRIEDEKKELQLSIDRYSQREYKKGTGNVVFSHSKEDGYRKCRLFSFQRESMRGTGHVVFARPKENPRGTQEMWSFLIPKRIQEGCRKCRL
jgi:hypothetical protein